MRPGEAAGLMVIGIAGVLFFGGFLAFLALLLAVAG